jgi:peroxiredoxin
MMVPGLALRAQDAAAAAAAPPAVGDMAPDFTLPGATAAGPSGALRLSDLRGKTVVLAFFFQARTKG